MPIEVALTAERALLPAGVPVLDLTLVYWDGTAWTEEPATMTANADGTLTLTAQVDHFTIFALAHRPGLRAFVTAPVFSTSGQSLVVFPGGSVEQLGDAMSAANASGVWVQDGGGAFALLVAVAPDFVKERFRARFPNGISGPIAVTLTR